MLVDILLYYCYKKARLEKYGHIEVAEALTKLYLENINKSMLVSDMIPNPIVVTCEGLRKRYYKILIHVRLTIILSQYP